MPMSSGKLHRVDFKLLIDKITGRIEDWKSKSQSYAGKMQLVNSVVGGIR
ncbi:hypothetical protein LINPERHAP1_LOCUS16058 [Linum perenne]